MTIIRRSRIFVLLPSIILGLLVLNLIWDIIKINLDPGVIKQWPWRFNLLDISTCATLAGIVAGLLLTRAQFARSIRPAIGWRAWEVKKSNYLVDSAWTVYLYNHGPGNCQVNKARYSYALTDRPPSGWKTWDMTVEELADMGMMRNRDYYLEDIGVGFSIPVAAVLLEDSELAAFTSACLAKLSSLDVMLEIEDALGDIYARTIECLRDAHKATEFKNVNIARASRFRKR